MLTSKSGIIAFSSASKLHNLYNVRPTRDAHLRFGSPLDLVLEPDLCDTVCNYLAMDMIPSLSVYYIVAVVTIRLIC